jgi:hypothetical protein
LMIRHYDRFLEPPVGVVVVALWLVGLMLLGSVVLALRYAWVLLA